MKEERKIEVQGMTCSGCEGAVKKIISRHFEIDIENVSASHEENRATVKIKIADIDSVLQVLDDAGFPAKRI